MASSLSDILSTIQNGVIALNNLAVQVKGSFTTILSRFVTDEANIAILQALVPAPKITNALSADVLLNNIAVNFDGPSIAQGTSGTWFVSGTVTVADTAGAANIVCILWDGTTNIASTVVSLSAIALSAPVTLSGYLTSPAGNIRISCRDVTSVNGKILFNLTGTSRDSTLYGIRIA